MKNIFKFEESDRCKFRRFKENNPEAIEIRGRFGNGYILRDNKDTITDNIVQQYNLIDDSNYYSDGTKANTRYLVKTFDQLEKIIKECQHLKFVYLHYKSSGIDFISR